MESVKKIFALILLVMLVLSVLLSVSFVSHGTLHDCVGEECQICAVIHRCAQMLEELLAVASFAALLGLVVFTIVCSSEIFGKTASSVTPVRLKVKLSN